MSQYIVLIYEDQARYATMPTGGWDELVAAHGTFTSKVAKLGGTLTGGG